MNKSKKICVVACLHGDELFGLKVVARLQALKGDHISVTIAHPEAIAKRCRYIESDLNRSFGKKNPDSVESSIAQHIKEEIKSFKPDIVIDLHSVENDVGCVAILAENNDRLIRLAAQLDMEYVVVMPKSIAKDSLIGTFPDRALSLEFGINLRSDKLAIQIAQAILAVGQERQRDLPTSIPVYQVDRLIGKDEAAGETLINYEYHKELKGYPFLVGKDEYDEYRGFLANKLFSHKLL